MSMYTQLLDAAYGERPHPLEEGTAVAEVLRCRFELEEHVPPGIDPDAVPVVLALQVGYDVALLGLARLVGVETDPGRFEQPQRERQRLEQALRDLGIRLEVPVAEESSADA
jgi:predicted PP-loop superfamily ATPase